MKSIRDMISILSDEEMAMHRDIIEECQKRERNLQESRDVIMKNHDRISSLLKKIVEDVEVLSDIVSSLNPQNRDRREDDDVPWLLVIPDDRFFHG